MLGVDECRKEVVLYKRSGGDVVVVIDDQY
jgi:hypothetical protein